MLGHHEVTGIFQLLYSLTGLTLCTQSNIDQTPLGSASQYMTLLRGYYSAYNNLQLCFKVESYYLQTPSSRKSVLELCSGTQIKEGYVLVPVEVRDA